MDRKRFWVSLQGELRNALETAARMEYQKEAILLKAAIREYLKAHYPELLPNNNGKASHD